MRFGKAATVAVVLLTLGTSGVWASPDGLTPDRVREAIQYGLAAPESDLAQYELRTDRTWFVNFDTPFLRVAQLSRAMKIQNTPVSEADVSPKTAADEVHLYAHARPEATQGRVTLPNIEYMFIVHPLPEGAETIQPQSLQSFVRRVPMGDEWSGPTRISRSVKAAFPLRAFVPGNEVRLVFEGGEVQTVKITADLLARVR